MVALREHHKPRDGGSLGGLPGMVRGECAGCWAGVDSGFPLSGLWRYDRRSLRCAAS